MVGSIIQYTCDTCGHEYLDYEDARTCELQHITDRAVANMKADLARIFREAKPKKAAIRNLRGEHDGEVRRG